MSIALGTRYTFTKVFLVGSTPTDPTVVRFLLREHVDGTELEWTYNAAPVSGTHYPVGMNPVVKNGTGDYSVAYDSRKPERVTGFFVGTGVVFDATATTLFVRHAEIAAIDAPSS
ncbi:MAG: hypothetical protein V4515_14170 [Chloroflexota bacterium]